MGRSVKRVLLALAGIVLLAAIGIAIGCARGDGDGGPPPIDTATMAFLSEARALHHRADLEEHAGNLPGAVAAMQRLVRAQRPHPDRPTPEVEEVLADAYARLAELELKRGDVAAATKAIDDGLAHAPEVTYFRGHLVEVQGLAMEATASELADAGKNEEAARARERAIQLLEEVVKIQEEVIERSLAARDGGGTEGRR